MQTIFVRAIQDSIESKSSCPRTAEMTGSTSYIIPLRSESDEEYEPPEPLKPYTRPGGAFQNKVSPADPKTPPHTEIMLQPARLVQSRSPLFRARSREYDRERAGPSESPAGSAAAPMAVADTSSTEMFIRNESAGTAKTRRSLFSNKSKSAGSGTIRSQSTHGRPNSTKSSKKSKPNRLSRTT